MRSLLAKRLFDVFLSLFGILISSPLWLMISILICIEDRGHIFYLQERVGKNGRIFKVIKFRSMIPNAEQHTGPVQARENDERTTRIGRILRKTALDELPQLINILKGDMSFVGPRALRPSEIQNSTGNSINLFDYPGIEIRHSITPGLTGIAQVFAPFDLPLSQKLHYDRWYIKNARFSLDIWLIMVSFLITFKGNWETKDKKLGMLRDDK